MAKKTTASKGKEKEKVVEKPPDTKKKESAPAIVSNKASTPAVQPAPPHVVHELVTVQEEPEDEIGEMDILQSRGASENGLENGGDGGGNGGWDGGGGGGDWNHDQYDNQHSTRNSQMGDGWDEKNNAARGQWESTSQNIYSPRQMPAAPPGSPPPLLTPPPTSFPHPEVGPTKVTKHSEIPGTEIGANSLAGQQQFGQFQAQPPQPSNDDPSRVPLNASAVHHWMANTGFSSTGGAKARSVAPDPRGAYPKGGPYRGPPNPQADLPHHAQKTEPRSALKAAGGTGLAKANTPWGQPKNTDPWGEPKYPDPRLQHPVSDHSATRGTTKAWETWGKPVGWAKPTYDDDDDDEDDDESSDETVDGRWGAASAWDTNHHREDDRDWKTGGKKQSKVTFAPLSPGGTQRVLSPQEHSQILSSLLNSPNQNPYPNVKSGHHGHHQSVPNPQMYVQHQYPQHQPQHPSNKHKHEKVSQQPFGQHFQHQQQQHHGYPQEQDQNVKKTQKTKQKAKQKQAPADAWGNQRRTGGEDDNDWGAGDNSWGNDGWDEQGDKWGNGGGSKIDWGDDNGGGGGGGGGGGAGGAWGTGSNDVWGAGGGNDAWGQPSGSKDNWGPEAGHQDQWGQGTGSKKGKGKGKGKNNWDAMEEEEDSDADEWGIPHKSNKSKRSARSSVQIETPYTMPSKTLAHAYRGTTVSLNSDSVDRNKIKEYTDIQFIESRGEALLPVQNAIFGRKFRMAKDRIHWLFSPDKDERVSSLLAWIQAMEYNLGAFGLHKFLQSRERGALFANANYRPEKNPNQPAFDWLIFDDLQQTRDKTIQESVVSYNPAQQVVIFVFLPSKTGNSVAMWRRKVNVPNNTRLMLQNEIKLALAGLRKQEAYEVHVDELPPPKKPAPRATLTRHQRHRSLPAPATDHTEKKKKRKWWQFLRFET